MNKSLPTPPPSLIGTTDPNPDRPSPFLSTPTERRQRAAQTARLRKPYTVDLTLFASKKKVHKSAVVRERCKRRCREAIRLVVVRNASASSESKEGIVLHEDNVRETGPRKWLLPGRSAWSPPFSLPRLPDICADLNSLSAGYHYIMNITLETYRGPLPDLVTSLREALKTLKVGSPVPVCAYISLAADAEDLGPQTKAEAAALAAQLADIEIAPRTRLPDPVASG